ncbi:MAG: hypothetical protein ACREHV_04240, partial [Rhizomicrobium sp.]
MIRRPKIAPAAAAFLKRSCAIGSAVAIAVLLGCMPVPPPAPIVPRAAPSPLPPTTRATHPLSGEQSAFLRLGNLPQGQT